MSNGQKNAQTSVNVQTPLKYMWTSYTSPPNPIYSQLQSAYGLCVAY